MLCRLRSACSACGERALHRRVLAQRDHRQARRALVHAVHQREGALRGLGLVLRELAAEDHGGQPAVRTGDDAGVGLVVDDDRLPAALFQLVLDLADAHTGDALLGSVVVRDQDRKVGLELHRLPFAFVQNVTLVENCRR